MEGSEDSALISVLDVINRPFSALTARGWLKALRVTGQIDNSEMKKAGRVMKAFKDPLASRNEATYARLAERKSEFDSDWDQEEEDDRRNEEDDEEEFDRQERQADEEDEDVYSDDMRASSRSC